MVSSAETTAQRVAVPSSLFNLPLILTLLKLLPIPGLHLKAERLGTVLYTFLFAVGVWGPSSHLLLPSIRSCSGVSCVGDPLAPSHGVARLGTPRSSPKWGSGPEPHRTARLVGPRRIPFLWWGLVRVLP